MTAPTIGKIPGKKVPPACEPAADLSISRAWGYRSPVINSSTAGHGTCQLGQRSGNEPVEDGDGYKLVDNARGATIAARVISYANLVR